jgi:hypothetical protein
MIAANEGEAKRQWMTHFSIGHIMRLRDGSFAVRSVEDPECEGRDLLVWPARELFRQAMTERAHQAIAEGELPPLYRSLEDARASLPEHCEIQIDEPDRMPNTLDYAVIVEIALAEEEVERLKTIRIGKLLPEASM